VVIKVHVQRMTAGSATRAAKHLGYIERDGVEKDGSRGVLYGPEGHVQRAVFEQPRLDERHQFRIIVSPEDGNELELTGYVRRLMAQVERDVGRRLEWAAVNHYNTDNAHAHIVVRGVALDGKELRLDRSYISRGMRWRAQELATEELGLRHEFEIKRAYAREVTQERFTTLDRELERQSEDNVLELRAPPKRAGSIDRSTLLARIEQLEAMQLAERLSASTWALCEGWQRTLRELGTRGDILQQIHKAIRGDPARYHVVRPGQELPHDPQAGREEVLVGRVASKGLSDELKGTFYVVLETPSGAAYHAPIGAGADDTLRLGDLVTFGSKPEPAVRPVDRHIADVARGRDGTYAVDAAAAPEDGARTARRLRELERLGLVTSAPSGRWNVPADLLEQLEARHRAQPARHRLLVTKLPLSVEAQVHHAGPVWLDHVDPASLAPSGFGAAVARALAQRREVLRELRIAADDPHRTAKLHDLEQRAVGKDIAARTGQQYVAHAPARFRGRVQASPADSTYLMVTDGTRFLLVPATANARTLAGKMVGVSRDAKGMLTLRALDRDRER
jgi:type IV secretory pathway VirD2 relaxase